MLFNTGVLDLSAVGIDARKPQELAYPTTNELSIRSHWALVRQDFQHGREILICLLVCLIPTHDEGKAFPLGQSCETNPEPWLRTALCG